ncbi:hypothetical protein HED22_09340 [Thalassospira sp. HF15]|uniref:hypothetical protein n=1 Tax=Thalassospira sp. HF15 TaxID=2722755 RepID=UPI00143087F0|nr:hypothetical protein [Thalassospira sp. HF15]NIY75846.1 hypothetical protein [Thalassospira sp. HF15]
MAGFWSIVGLVFKSLITGSDTVDDMGDGAGDDLAADDVLCRYGIARFTAADTNAHIGADSADNVSELVSAALKSVPETSGIRIDQFFSPNPDAADLFQAIREAQLGVLNVAHRKDSDTVFWGREDPGNGYVDLHMVSDALTSSLYDLMLPQTYSFRQPSHADVSEALRVLLNAQLVLKSRGGEQRALQIARLAAILEDLQDRVLGGDTFLQAGSGVALAYGFGAFVLSETGDRSYCATALRVMEPHIRQMVSDIADKPTAAAGKTKTAAPSGLKGEALDGNDQGGQENQLSDLLDRISDFSKVDPRTTAALALYGSLVNWSLVANLKTRSGALAVAIWRMLERRIELSMGSPVDRALSICKLGEAMVLTGKDKEDASLVDKGAGHYRRALGMINARVHGPLYATIAYGLAEAIVSSATIRDVTIPDTQVVPVFQAALKVCTRRDHPYIWGRIMFALATVYLTNGNLHKDIEMLTHARMSYSQSYEAFTEAGAKGAARAASGGYTRSENFLSQLGHRKAVMDATGGNGNAATDKDTADAS